MLLLFLEFYVLLFSFLLLFFQKKTFSPKVLLLGDQNIQNENVRYNSNSRKPLLFNYLDKIIDNPHPHQPQMQLHVVYRHPIIIDIKFKHFFIFYSFYRENLQKTHIFILDGYSIKDYRYNPSATEYAQN